MLCHIALTELSFSYSDSTKLDLEKPLFCFSEGNNSSHWPKKNVGRKRRKKPEDRWCALSMQSSSNWRALLMDGGAFDGTRFHIETMIIPLLSKPTYKLLVHRSLLLVIS